MVDNFLWELDFSYWEDFTPLCYFVDTYWSSIHLELRFMLANEFLLEFLLVECLHAD